MFAAHLDLAHGVLDGLGFPDEEGLYDAGLVGARLTAVGFGVCIFHYLVLLSFGLFEDVLLEEVRGFVSGRGDQGGGFGLAAVVGAALGEGEAMVHVPSGVGRTVLVLVEA